MHQLRDQTLREVDQNFLKRISILSKRWMDLYDSEDFSSAVEALMPSYCPYVLENGNDFGPPLLAGDAPEGNVTQPRAISLKKTFNPPVPLADLCLAEKMRWEQEQRDGTFHERCAVV
jgi:hypothetical protein